MLFMWAIAILAVTALVLDLIVHIAAVAGLNPQDWVQPDWLARTLFFALLVAVLLIANMVQSRRQRRAAALGITLDDDEPNPQWFVWLRRVVIAYGLFCAINYGVLDLRRAGGSPLRLGDGSHVVDPGHGRPIRAITAAEYDHWRRRSVRGGSGLLLMFYLQVAFDKVRSARNPVRAGMKSSSAQASGGRVISVVTISVK